MDNSPKLYSAKEFAELLQISERTLRKLLKDGSLPTPIQVGGQLRWYPEDVADTVTRPEKGGSR